MNHPGLPLIIVHYTRKVAHVGNFSAYTFNSICVRTNMFSAFTVLLTFSNFTATLGIQVQKSYTMYRKGQMT